MLLHLRFLGIALLLTSSVLAQNVRIPGQYNEIKAENGLILAWHGNAEDRAVRQIDVYNEQGNLLASLSPLRFVPEAKLAAIWDVAALPERIIAVAVDFRQAPDKIPAPSLLGFDFKGNLLFALALDPSREARAVTIDKDGHIWTLTMGAGSREPSETPMVVEYSASGKVLKEILKRSEFPTHSTVLKEDNVMGQAEFGHTSQSVWFWLPGSTDLVKLNAKGSLLEKSVTGLPRQSTLETPTRIVLTDDGDLCAQIRSRQNERQRAQFTFVTRSETSKHWKAFYPPCPNCMLIGNDETKAFFAGGEGNEIAIYSTLLQQ